MTNEMKDKIIAKLEYLKELIIQGQLLEENRIIGQTLDANQSWDSNVNYPGYEGL